MWNQESPVNDYVLNSMRRFKYLHNPFAWEAKRYHGSRFLDKASYIKAKKE